MFEKLKKDNILRKSIFTNCFLPKRNNILLYFRSNKWNKFIYIFPTVYCWPKHVYCSLKYIWSWISFLLAFSCLLFLSIPQQIILAEDGHVRFFQWRTAQMNLRFIKIGWGIGWDRIGWGRIGWGIGWGRIGWGRIGWGRIGWGRIGWGIGWSLAGRTLHTWFDC